MNSSRTELTVKDEERINSFNSEWTGFLEDRMKYKKNEITSREFTSNIMIRLFRLLPNIINNAWVWVKNNPIKASLGFLGALIGAALGSIYLAPTVIGGLCGTALLSFLGLFGITSLEGAAAIGAGLFGGIGCGLAVNTFIDLMEIIRNAYSGNPSLQMNNTLINKLVNDAVQNTEVNELRNTIKELQDTVVQQKQTIEKQSLHIAYQRREMEKRDQENAHNMEKIQQRLELLELNIRGHHYEQENVERNKDRKHLSKKKQRKEEQTNDREKEEPELPLIRTDRSRQVNETNNNDRIIRPIPSIGGNVFGFYHDEHASEDDQTVRSSTQNSKKEKASFRLSRQEN